MYTSTPPRLPDPPFRFFEGLVLRLSATHACECKWTLSALENIICLLHAYRIHWTCSQGTLELNLPPGRWTCSAPTRDCGGQSRASGTLTLSGPDPDPCSKWNSGHHRISNNVLCCHSNSSFSCTYTINELDLVALAARKWSQSSLAVFTLQ